MKKTRTMHKPVLTHDFPRFFEFSRELAEETVKKLGNFVELRETVMF